MRYALLIALGLAGIDRAEGLDVISGWADLVHLAHKHTIANDATLLFAAGTPEGWGLAIVAGTGSIAFALDRNGKVLTSRVARSSGSAALDQETLDTVRRAQPFPPPPANMPGNSFDFTVPIRFNIR